MGLSKTTYEERRAAGRCVQCGEDANGKSKCPTCTAKDRAARAARIARRKADGLCQNSGCREPALPERTVCQTCSDKAAATALARYYRNKAAGVCRYCGADSGGEARCEDCKEAFAVYVAEWYEARKAAGVCANCGGERDTETVLCANCRERKNQTGRVRWLRLKSEAFAAYGGPVCVGCGEDEIEVLEIDHITGGGNSHRRQIGPTNTYLWLKQQGYPPGYRVLCPTCNKKAHRGLLTVPLTED